MQATAQKLDVREVSKRERWAVWYAAAAVGVVAMLPFLNWGIGGNALAVEPVLLQALAAVAYLLAARAVLSLGTGTTTRVLFALVNLGGIALFLNWPAGMRRGLFFLAAYLAMVTWHYGMLRGFATRDKWWPWLAFASPLAALAVTRYAGALFEPLLVRVPGLVSLPLDGFFVGISYTAFRLSHLVLEVRNGVVPRPGYWEYLGYSFFVPTLITGPISPYSVHRGSVEQAAGSTPLVLPLARIAVGLAKYQFLGSLFNQVSYRGLLLDGHPHPPVDLVLAAVAYHLYLYCNFSGFCDMAIGAAGLLGIEVKENFRNPLAARNPQDYWNRWHITLSTYMRDVVFTPLSKFLVGRVSPAARNHAVVMAILVVFLLVGLWHGSGWNFAVYGAIHGLGVSSVYYYTAWLKRKLGAKRYRAYEQNRVVYAIAVAMNFTFVTASLFWFANDFDTIGQLFKTIRF